MYKNTQNKWNLHVSDYECRYTNGKSVCTNYIENKYIEDILNGADSVLSEDLVPVKISSSGVVTKVNESSEDGGLWFSDYAYLPAATDHWFKRGGYSFNDSGAGVFCFDRSDGRLSSVDSFRVVFHIKNIINLLAF